MKVYDNIVELIGKTPMVRLDKYSKEEGLEANLIAKLEYFNPGGSVKDRVAYAMIKNAEEKGQLKPGGTIIEPTSGNTGIGLALMAANCGYKLILTMPETMSVERRNLLIYLGAEIVLTDGGKGMSGAIEKAKELQSSIDNSIIMGQFDNAANPMAHYKTTGPEIYEDMNGKIDYFISAVGTGGTCTGVAKYLKEQNSNIKVIAVEPSTSAVMSGKTAGAHGIQGIGAGFIPKVMDMSLVDEVMPVDTEVAYEKSRLVAKKEGIIVGISSGAALAVAGIIAGRLEGKGKNIVVLLPDTGERYISTPLFNG